MVRLLVACPFLFVAMFSEQVAPLYRKPGLTLDVCPIVRGIAKTVDARSPLSFLCRLRSLVMDLLGPRSIIFVTPLPEHLNGGVLGSWLQVWISEERMSTVVSCGRWVGER